MSKVTVLRPKEDADLIAQREAYLTLCKFAISVAQSYGDLVTWFKEQRAFKFRRYKINQNSDEYKIIVAACRTRRAELESKHAAAA